jgi:hypothetical protein
VWENSEDGRCFEDGVTDSAHTLALISKGNVKLGGNHGIRPEVFQN